MIALVEVPPARRLERGRRGILLIVLTIIFILAVMALQRWRSTQRPPACRRPRRPHRLPHPTTIGALSAIGIARMDPRQRNVLAMSGGRRGRRRHPPCSTRPARSPTATAKRPRCAHRLVDKQDLARAAYLSSTPIRPRGSLDCRAVQGPRAARPPELPEPRGGADRPFTAQTGCRGRLGDGTRIRRAPDPRRRLGSRQGHPDSDVETWIDSRSGRRHPRRRPRRAAGHHGTSVIDSRTSSNPVWRPGSPNCAGWGSVP